MDGFLKQMIKFFLPVSKNIHVFDSIFIILSAMTITACCWVSFQMAFNGDFWEHAATIKALQEDWVSPPHPILNVDAPHHLFTPYHLFISAIANIFGLDAPTALASFSAINISVFLFGLSCFVNCFCYNKHAREIKIVQLLLTLFGWGGHVWFFSGFLSVRALAFIAPYPSTLTFGIMLIAITALDNWYRTSAKSKLLIFLISYLFVALTHQITFVFMSILAFCICVTKIKSEPHKTAISIMIAGIILLSLISWPYFDFIELTQSNNEFIPSNSSMFEAPLTRLYPALLFLPAVFFLKKLPISYVVPWAFILTTVFYISGYFGYQPMMGRLISFIAFLGHFMTATAMVVLISIIKEKNLKFFNIRKITLASAVILMCFISMPMLSLGELRRFNVTAHNGILDYQSAIIADTYINNSDVLLGPTGLGWQIPSLSGKLVASRTGLAFVEDHVTRQANTNSICSDALTVEEIFRIIEEYHVTKLIFSEKCQPLRDVINHFPQNFKFLSVTPRYFIFSVQKKTI